MTALQRRIAKAKGELEKEMAKLAENQVSFQALTQMMTFKFNQLRTAMREGEF